MFALIGMIIVGLWLLRLMHAIILNLMIGYENQKQINTANFILSGSLEPSCNCCGQVKCIYIL